MGMCLQGRLFLELPQPQGRGLLQKRNTTRQSEQGNIGRRQEMKWNRGLSFAREICWKCRCIYLKNEQLLGDVQLRRTKLRDSSRWCDRVEFFPMTFLLRHDVSHVEPCKLVADFSRSK